MSKAFQLVSDYQASGDQPRAIARLLEGIGRPGAPDPAGGDRFGQDLYHGQRYRRP
jgi:hypothetical protein